MEEGHYDVKLINYLGVNEFAKIYVRDGQMIGQGSTLSFYGSFYHRTLILNISRNSLYPTPSILNDFQAYRFSGQLIDMDEGYYFLLDDHCDLQLSITFTKSPQREKMND